MLRYAGLFTWAMVGVGLFMNGMYGLPSSDYLSTSILLSVSAYFGFGIAYWLATHSFSPRDVRVYEILLLLAMTTSAIAVSRFTYSGLGAILMMVMAGVIPWLVPTKVGVPWLILQHLALIPTFIQMFVLQDPDNDDADWGLWLSATMQALLYIGYSGFVFVTGYVAKQQAQAREDQRRLNAELRATRALLADSTRVAERLRISRELHDLLGHHLTALSLNLEVAGHLTEGRAHEHVKQSHTLAKLLLTDVREAVSEMREDDSIDVAAAIATLVEGVPSLQIDLNIDEPLAIDDADRAHVILRCAQEIITNTVRHAAARRLQISLRRENSAVHLTAKDDGVGRAEFAPGHGLFGMRERLAAYGGRVAVKTAPGQGFELDIYLPLETDT